MATAIMVRRLLAAALWVMLPGASFCRCAEIAWETAPPGRLGVSRAKLDAMRAVLAAHRTTSFLLVRRGRIVYEWYAPGWNASRRHYTASLAKALVGGVSFLLAWNDGRIDPDDRAANYIAPWRHDRLKSRITLRELATHSSGIEDAEQDHIPHLKLPGWKGAFWRQEPDPFTMAVYRAPVVFPPGTRYAYSNPGMAALAWAITASLRDAPQKDLRSLLKVRVMEPLGIPAADWSVGYGKTFHVDGLPLVADWGGGRFTARAVARVGQWMLQHGEWNGKRLVSPKLAEEVVSDARTPLPPRPPGNPQPACGLGWYTNFDGVWPRLPRDSFAGAGAGNQILLVVPSLDMVVVRNGELLADPVHHRMFWGGVVDYLFDPLMEAVAAGAGRPPYPPSRIIGEVHFASSFRIQRRASGSDNWPITWADDGALYTAYGDGNGFRPYTEKKLSLGFARVLGPPERFHGENIRSATGERTGDGPRGAKASGLVMVNGVLYAWVRNVGNSRLIWSADHAKTWHWGFRFRTSFGAPAFLNFGRDYAGARDHYVYTYSQDGPSAYASEDRLVLARVPKNRIRDRAAYEFFVGLAGGRPLWSRDIHRRGAVFRYPGHCGRVDAVYDPGLRRYLLAVGYGHQGGWGLYEAPAPWGPWRTAFHTPYWGLGNTHDYRLPAKWISADGRTLYLVFSGRPHNGVVWDAFCVRRMTLAPPE